MSTTKTMAERLDQLHANEASRDHLLKDGMRQLNAAEVAYLLNYRDYRNAYRHDIPRTRRGWLAKDVKRHIEGERVVVRTKLAPNDTSRARVRGKQRGQVPSEDAPIWGGDAA